MASTSDSERCTEAAKLQRIDAAFHDGDLEALRGALDDPDGFPNNQMPLAIGPCLEYAIYHSPLAFIRTLLEFGADPNQRGINDYTALHMAVAERNLDAVTVLLAAGRPSQPPRRRASSPRAATSSASISLPRPDAGQLLHGVQHHPELDTLDAGRKLDPR